ncbi:Opacity-associated protein A LysM-like domain protein [compost metagenome]
MAQVEGNDKPLSNMKVGQEVRIERDANGVITALSVTTADNTQALFRRQADGGYRRER